MSGYVFNLINPDNWYEWKVKGKVLVAQLCLTLCNSTDSSPPGSSVHGILQARILEWVAILFSLGSSQTRDWTWVSYIAGTFFTTWAMREFLLSLLTLIQLDSHCKRCWEQCPWSCWDAEPSLEIWEFCRLCYPSPSCCVTDLQRSFPAASSSTDFRQSLITQAWSPATLSP